MTRDTGLNPKPGARPPKPQSKEAPPLNPLICQGQRNKPLSWSCWHIFDFFLTGFTIWAFGFCRGLVVYGVGRVWSMGYGVDGLLVLRLFLHVLVDTIR